MKYKMFSPTNMPDVWFVYNPMMDGKWEDIVASPEFNTKEE